MVLQWLSRRLAAYLTKPITSPSIRTSTYEALGKSLQPGDVLLVEGNARISVAIKYLTQSTWSHAALYLGPGCGLGDAANGEPHVLIEADLEQGIRRLPLSFYRQTHTRICRPVGLDERDIATLRTYALGRLGDQYDLKNVFDLVRYLWPTLPVPARHRHKLMVFGSGDPTRTICSTFIAEGFQLLRYPVLPIVESSPSGDPACRNGGPERFSLRPYRLFTPRDFDASPYFRIIKPTLEEGFDYRTIEWQDT
ncbi:Permuted papain-like amidase enzyme, YaeF/YiiX, C92 family [Modicisalibacter muralis]|uniref:Permuted papain-like amidase enzyme, YaeF/YiiX, C92 family n=1 Tax=Modicisalibacter muralis TaxID=119000 RepID=A0A1G9JYK4_9GAMM|nr:YiiX/YebB-like N1pC/P60 family cysteine hydrolase [Halomonas muralis]SDL42135.1 Permuted papain-like amidase enzyme, YaeF/YiiX, C92 family [Halomonas muralis]